MYHRPRMCRTCLQMSRGDFKFVSLDANDPLWESNSPNLKEQLIALVPEMKIDGSGTVICTSCFIALRTGYEFKKMCQFTEQRFQNYNYKYRRPFGVGPGSAQFHVTLNESFNKLQNKNGFYNCQNINFLQADTSIDITEHHLYDASKPPPRKDFLKDPIVEQIIKTPVESPASKAEEKPAEVKPAEVKPAEVVKPTEVVKPPVEIKPVEVKPVEIKPVEVKPVDIKPVDLKPVEIKSIVVVKPADIKPVEIKPLTESKPNEVQMKPPVQIKPIDVIFKETRVPDMKRHQVARKKITAPMHIRMKYKIGSEISILKSENKTPAPPLSKLDLMIKKACDEIELLKEHQVKPKSLKCFSKVAKLTKADNLDKLNSEANSYYFKKLEVEISCEHCTKTFDTRYKLYMHDIEIHPDKQVWQCEKCDKAFITEINFKRHVDEEHVKPLLSSVTKSYAQSAETAKKESTSAKTSELKEKKLDDTPPVKVKEIKPKEKKIWNFQKRKATPAPNIDIPKDTLLVVTKVVEGDIQGDDSVKKTKSYEDDDEDFIFEDSALNSDSDDESIDIEINESEINQLLRDDFEGPVIGKSISKPDKDQEYKISAEQKAIEPEKALIKENCVDEVQIKLISKPEEKIADVTIIKEDKLLKNQSLPKATKQIPIEKEKKDEDVDSMPLSDRMKLPEISLIPIAKPDDSQRLLTRRAKEKLLKESPKVSPTITRSKAEKELKRETTISPVSEIKRERFSLRKRSITPTTDNKQRESLSVKTRSQTVETPQIVRGLRSRKITTTPPVEITKKVRESPKVVAKKPEISTAEVGSKEKEAPKVKVNNQIKEQNKAVDTVALAVENVDSANPPVENVDSANPKVENVEPLEAVLESKEDEVSLTELNVEAETKIETPELVQKSSMPTLDNINASVDKIPKMHLNPPVLNNENNLNSSLEEKVKTDMDITIKTDTLSDKDEKLEDAKILLDDLKKNTLAKTSEEVKLKFFKPHCYKYIKYVKCIICQKMCRNELQLLQHCKFFHVPDTASTLKQIQAKDENIVVSEEALISVLENTQTEASIEEMQIAVSEEKMEIAVLDEKMDIAVTEENMEIAVLEKEETQITVSNEEMQAADPVKEVKIAEPDRELQVSVPENETQIAVPEEVQAVPVKEAQAVPVKEVQAESVKEAQAVPVQEAQAVPVKEAQAESVQEAQAESVQEAQAESVQEAQAESVQEALAESVQEAQAESVKEAQAVPIKEAQAVPVKEAQLAVPEMVQTEVVEKELSTEILEAELQSVIPEEEKESQSSVSEYEEAQSTVSEEDAQSAFSAEDDNTQTTMSEDEEDAQTEVLKETEELHITVLKETQIKISEKEALTTVLKEAHTTVSEIELETVVSEKKSQIEVSETETNIAVPVEEPQTTVPEEKEAQSVPEKEEQITVPKKEEQVAVPENETKTAVSEEESLTAILEEKEAQATVSDEEAQIAQSEKEAQITLPEKEAQTAVLEQEETQTIVSKEKTQMGIPEEESPQITVLEKETPTTASEKETSTRTVEEAQTAFSDDEEGESSNSEAELDPEDLENVKRKMENVTYTCNICDKIVDSKKILRIHKHIHIPFSFMVDEKVEENYICYICDKRFVKDRFMKLHNMQFHCSKHATCKFCKKLFKNLFWFGRHKCTGIPEVDVPPKRPYERKRKSYEDDAEFVIEKHLSKRVKPVADKPVEKAANPVVEENNEEENSYICNICNRGFARFRFLKSHQKRMHIEAYKLAFGDTSLNSSSHLSESVDDVSENLQDSNLPNVSQEGNAEAVCPPPPPPADDVLDEEAQFLKSSASNYKRKSTDKMPKLQCDFCGSMIEENLYDKHIFHHNEQRTKKNRKSEDTSTDPAAGSTASTETDDKSAADSTSTPVPEKPTLPCQFCPRVFQRQYHLANHIRSHHEEGPEDDETNEENSENNTKSEPGKLLPCKFCDRIFQRKNHLSNHIRTHHENNDNEPNHIRTLPENNDNEPLEEDLTESCTTIIVQPRQYLPCKYCNRMFQRRNHLANHIRKNHQADLPPDQQEPIVEEKKPVEANHEINILKNESAELLECCGKQFKKKGHFAKHCRTKHPDIFCETTSDSAIRLKSPTPPPDTVANDSVNQSDVFNFDEKDAEGITNEDSFRKRKISDISETPETSTRKSKAVEGQSSDTPEGVVKRKRIITDSDGEPVVRKKKSNNPPPVDDDSISYKYECPTCFKKFKQITNLRDHSNVHTGNRPYPCNFCEPPRGFTQSSSLYAHIRRVHTSIVNNVEWENHSKSGNCTVCGCVFEKLAEMFLHAKEYFVEGGFVCQICKGKCNMSCHYTLHSGAFLDEGDNNISSSNNSDVETAKKPIRCIPCNKTFKKRKELKSHKKSLSHIKQTQSLKKQSNHKKQGGGTTSIEGLANSVGNILKTLSGMKKYRCFCGKNFAKRVHLKRHRRNFHRKNRTVIEKAASSSTDIVETNEAVDNIEKDSVMSENTNKEIDIQTDLENENTVCQSNQSGGEENDSVKVSIEENTSDFDTMEMELVGTLDLPSDVIDEVITEDTSNGETLDNQVESTVNEMALNIDFPTASAECPQEILETPALPYPGIGSIVIANPE